MSYREEMGEYKTRSNIEETMVMDFLKLMKDMSSHV